MKIFIVFALVIAVALAAPSSEVAPFIFGGVNALPGEFPFLVSIQHCFLGCSHICGGSIMTPIWVLTAAHCLTETSTRGSIDVFAGRHNLNHNEATEQRIEIEPNRWIIHPGWTSGRNFGPNDIALGRLASPLTFNNRVQPIRIPPPNTPPSGPSTFTGWGANSNGIGSGPVNILQKIMFSTITNEACRDAVREMNRDPLLVDNNKMCTGPLTGGTSTCDGDFGGPLLQNHGGANEVIVGVASWGVTPCGVRGAPTGIYTMVTEYSNWISANTGVMPA